MSPVRFRVSPPYPLVGAVSSVGRALPSHGRSHRFESCTAHHATGQGNLCLLSQTRWLIPPKRLVPPRQWIVIVRIKAPVGGGPTVRGKKRKRKWRGGRAVECAGLENRCPASAGPWVRIPPPPPWIFEGPGMCWVYALLSEKEMCGHLGVSDEPRRGLPEPSRGNPSGHVVSALRRLSIPNATRPGTQR